MVLGMVVGFIGQASAAWIKVDVLNSSTDNLGASEITVERSNGKTKTFDMPDEAVNKMLAMCMLAQTSTNLQLSIEVETSWAVNDSIIGMKVISVSP